MDTEKSECYMNDRWLKEMHQHWKEAGRIAPPDKVGALLDQTVQQWQMVTAAMQGDEEAWRALYTTCFPHAYYIALNIVGDHETAEDVAIGCFSEIFQHRDRLKPEQSFVRLVSHIAKNRSISVLRQRKGINQVSIEEVLEQGEIALLPLVEDTDDPVELTERMELADIVREEVDNLPDNYREAITLHFFGEMSFEEAGKALGITKGAVQARCDRAKAILKERLAERLGDGSAVNGGDLT